jgi:hypothetical protein
MRLSKTTCVFVRKGEGRDKIGSRVGRGGVTGSSPLSLSFSRHVRSTAGRQGYSRHHSRPLLPLLTCGQTLTGPILTPFPSFNSHTERQHARM